MSQPIRQPKISRDEIRAIYAQGEAAVIELVEGLLERIEQLEVRLEALEDRGSKNSRNSSKPPSGDGFGQRTRSLRSKSERRSGGQPDHPGHNLEWGDAVDRVVEHAVNQCQGCGATLESEPIAAVIGRQVHDLPPLQIEVTEHQAAVKTCPVCGLENRGQFPVEVNAPIQYGSVVKGAMVYLADGQ